MGVVYKAKVKIGTACKSVWNKFKISTPKPSPTPTPTPSSSHVMTTPTITPSPTPSITPSKTPRPSTTPMVSQTLSKPNRPKKKSFFEKLLEFLAELFKS